MKKDQNKKPELNFAKAFRTLRLFHDLTQKDLAKSVGFSPSYINELESGRKHVKMEVLQAYSERFNFCLSDVVFLAEQIDFAEQSRLGEDLIGVFPNPKVLKMLELVQVLKKK